MDSRSLRVGIVEDHPLFMELLAEGLERVDDLKVVATASHVAEAKKWMKPEELDVVILDVELPDGNGFGLGLQMRRQNPDLGIVMLSGRDVLELMHSLPREEFRGWSFLSKQSTKSLDYVASVIRATSRGETVIDRSFTDRSRAKAGTGVAALSPRQFEVLRAVARGQVNRSIADDLGIAANSVGNHLIAIYAILRIPRGKNARVAAVLEFLESTSR